MHHITCRMDRTSSGTTSPWHYTITWGIYCLQRWALQRSWRPGCSASPPQGDTLTLSPIHQLLCTNIYQHVSQHPQHHHTILDIEGIRGSSLRGTGSKFPPLHCGKSCETNSLLQCAVLQILRQSLFNQISTKRIIWTFIQVTSLKNHKSTETLQNSFAKTTYSDILSLLSL